ncbi:MAG: hypothetical protein WA211_13850 [Candidatus Acidiferrales bacterium]
MKMNHSLLNASVRVALGVVLAGCFFATTAQAQSRFEGTFKLTNEVHWRAAVLPPGDYSIKLDTARRMILVSDAHTNKPVALEAVRIDSDAQNRDSQLVVEFQGNRRVVSSARLAGFGEVFHSTAKSQAAKEAGTQEAILIERTWVEAK